MGLGLDTAARASRAAAWRPMRGAWVRRDEAIMGTAIHVELWADDRRRGECAADAVMAEMHRIDRAMSPCKHDSELSRINREAAHAAVPLSEEMFALLERALEFSALSDGAFDISYAAAGHLYDYRERVVPGEAALAAARAAIGWDKLELDDVARSLRFAVPGMRIDLGGFAKGHAVDQAAAILRGLGIEHAVVAAGGDSRVIGDRRGRPWSVAIRHPRRPGEAVAMLPLEDTAISTSGDYERCFDDATSGARHHHILDPRTGRSPASGVTSVTILAPDCLTAEALSKTVFVKGVREGLALVESRGGVDAVVVDAAGALHCSSGLLGADAPARPQ